MRRTWLLRGSPLGWASGVLLVGAVTASTLAVRGHEVRLSTIAASAAKIAAGQVWLLPTSGLVVDRPVYVGLVAFGLLGFAALGICGTRVFWVCAVVGHIGSTLAVYAIIGASRQSDPDFVSRDELIAERPVWAVHEVETTVDFCPNNRVLTWLLGRLNFQIEHHLFPGVPHTHYPAIALIVQRNCLNFRHLRRMGQLGLPVSIEMG